MQQYLLCAIILSSLHICLIYVHKSCVLRNRSAGTLTITLGKCLVFLISPCVLAGNGENDGPGPSADHHLPGAGRHGDPQPQRRHCGGRSGLSAHNYCTRLANLINLDSNRQIHGSKQMSEITLALSNVSHLYLSLLLKEV